ncbi:DUF4974 domain-containing protein [Niastella caeni]|uniref:DUF4974 domain-containing protein n=1 Tax=Niastella caeni TaxID=2569763 RepID=A0A4V4H0A9_9BACT|nr:FecR family protein [Niastella caeni]THU35856.1 DUF4974 domain-containing protein [Niastella caeni]
MVDKNRILLLLEKYSRKETTIAEENELLAIVNQAGRNNSVQNELAKIFEETEPMPLPEGTRKEILAKIFTPAIPDEAGFNSASSEPEQAPVSRMFPVWKVAIAATVMLMLGAGSYFLFFAKAGKKAELAKTALPVSNDVKAPENNRAMIILENGEKVFLDSAGNGILASLDNVNVLKTANGKIVYSPVRGSVNEEAAYHTLFNPRGSKVQFLTLSDGTKVWLNNESSIKYPIVFTGNERKVEITGEAYFEVAKNAAKPFKVKKVNNDAVVQVLGTHFNMNTYDDEETIKVTLLEGSVKVGNLPAGRKEEEHAAGNPALVILKPGEQAVLGANSPFIIDHSPNLEQVMAWKNGMFVMEKSGIGSILKQIARWYDVDVVYENGVPEGTLSGEVPRDLTLSHVLKLLEYSGVNAIIDGKRIIVKG